MKIKIVMRKKIWNIFSVYVPQVDRPETEKEAFWGMLDDVTTLLYRAETCALTRRLVDVLVRWDHRMLRCMAGVRWQDGRSSSEVA